MFNMTKIQKILLGTKDPMAFAMFEVIFGLQANQRDGCKSEKRYV